MLCPEMPEALAILDWELSTLGQPIVDLACFCAYLHLPKDHSTRGLVGIDQNQLGIPFEKKGIEQYCRLPDIAPIESWRIYPSFSLFRLLAINPDVPKQTPDGDASADQALRVGTGVPFLAEMT
jgi:aminoglycoside phosphotransferase (APT) family kinase protein